MPAAKAMYQLAPRPLAAAAYAKRTNRASPTAGQQCGRPLQPQASETCHGRQLRRCCQQSRSETGTLAGVAAAASSELVDCGGAELTHPASQSGSSAN